MMDSDRERWKDDLLATLEGLEPVPPDPFLFARIEARLAAPPRVSRPALGLALAGVGLLLLLDLQVVRSIRSSTARATVAATAPTTLLADLNLYDR
jgi:hypothetical protein